MIGAIKAMFSFFTMIRVDVTEKDMEEMDRKLYLVPVIGAFYGLIAVVLMVLLTGYIPVFASAVLTLFVIQAMNRFLHVDGTIDVGDGLTVAGGREDHLRALKDTRIGAGGMAFAFFVMMLTVAALTGIWIGFLVLVPFIAEVLAKNSMVSAAAFGKPGDGMAGNSVRNTTVTSLLYSSVISMAIISVYVVLVDIFGWFGPGLDIVKLWSSLLLVLVASVVTGAIMSRISERNFGTVNGDVLGATNEISRMVTLLIMLALIPVI